MEKTWNKWWTFLGVVWPPRAQWRLIQEVIKERRTTSKDCRPHLPRLRSCSWFNNKKETVQKRHPWESSKTKATTDQKEHKDSSHICQNILIIPKTFGQLFCGLMRQKLNFLEGVYPLRYIWRINNTAFHKRKIMPTVKHGGGSVMVFRTWTTCHNWWNHEFCTLSTENPEGECPAISSSSTLGYAAGQWSQTY